MVWLVEKKIVHHILDTGFERVDIPVRVKFEFEVKEGLLVPETLSKEILYNQHALKKRYPDLSQEVLHSAVKETVENEIVTYMRQSGFLHE